MVDSPLVLTSDSDVLSVFRGDSESWTFQYRDSNGDPVSLAGHDVFFTIKTEESDVTDDSDAVYTQKIAAADLDSAASGDQAFSIDASSSAQLAEGVYFWDVQLVSGSEVKTVGKGEFHVTADITRRTS